jgi:REP element-mobilizing transposase RayT
MSRSSLFTEPLHGGKIFHVYNQTNNKEPLFISMADRLKFLANLERFIAPFTNIFAFNLLTNHFHLLLETLQKEDFLRSTPKYFINDLPAGCKKLVLAEEDNMDLILRNRFTAMLSGYVTYFNYRHKRKGNFLHRPFCRKWIHSPEYFKKAVFYIHANAVHHGIQKHILDHEWTSFHAVVAQDNSLISLDKLYAYFGGEYLFRKYHDENQLIEAGSSFIIEENTVFCKWQDEEE